MINFIKSLFKACEPAPELGWQIIKRTNADGSFVFVCSYTTKYGPAQYHPHKFDTIEEARLHVARNTVVKTEIVE